MHSARLHEDCSIPLAVLADSYKACHPAIFPPAKKMVAYGEFRRSFENDSNDQRILFYGLQYIIDKYIARRWTMSDIEDSAKFFSTHNAGFTPYPFPYELLKSIVTECDGWLPIKVEGLAEGAICYPHTPVYTITAEGKYSALVTWMETLLTMVWYPTTVATLSRRIRTLIQQFFDQSVEPSLHFLIESRLHDFGFRGCTSVEQAMIGGTAHLLSFRGSDTAVAAYNAQYCLNDGKAVAESVPATEHSIMMSYPNELSAINAVIDTYGDGEAYSMVMDSFDYERALSTLLPTVVEAKKSKKGIMIIRPDSGDPTTSVLSGLKELDKLFGSQINTLGYKVLNGCGVIQGDGVDYRAINTILTKVLEAGYSAQNVAFGMGSGLLHRVNRDTMSFATKLSYIEDVNGIGRDICKIPLTDPSKTSLPGLFTLKRDEKGRIIVLTVEEGMKIPFADMEEASKIYYDCGKPVIAKECKGNKEKKSQTFDEIREQSLINWNCLPKQYDPVDQSIRIKKQQQQQQHHSKK